MNQFEQDPTQRFSDRAENYARYRPGYPPEVLDCLRMECGLTPSAVIADIGSGTGILTEMFLRNGNIVYGVEPNEAMRAAAEAALASYSGFRSIHGRAEATTLPDGAVDFVTAGQAFHWFDAAAAREEFRRILRPGGYVALVWNARLIKDDPLMSAYEQTLSDFGMGYHCVTHRSHDRDLETLFQGRAQKRIFTHARKMDFTTLWGGFLSASYAPGAADPAYEPMHRAMRRLFDEHEVNGFITFLYETNLYYGLLD